MTRFESEFPEPPWTYAPKEVDAWISSVSKGAHVSKLEAFKNPAGRLENLEVVIDLDAEKTRVEPSSTFRRWLEDLTGRATFETHFELAAVVELCMRTLKEGRFRNTVGVWVDEEAAYERNDQYKDLRSTVDLVTEHSHRSTRCDRARVRVGHVSDEDVFAIVDVRRVTKKNERSIGLKFDGDVEESDFRAILTYLSKNLNATFAAVV